MFASIILPSYMSPHPLIEEINFSGPLYQVLVNDPKQEEAYWVFLNLEEGQSGFCTCDLEEPCPHLRAAKEAVFADTVPLHRKFYESFWYALGLSWFRRFGNKKKEKLKEWKLTTTTDSSKKKIAEIFAAESAESEETSMKLSSLTPEEIMAWREGNPSEKVAFELSPWSDFAKWLFLAKDKLNITLEEGKKNWPSHLSISNGSFVLLTEIQEESWPLLAPPLNELGLPLKTYNRLHDWVKELKFEEDRKRLHLVPKESAGKKGVSLGEWKFVSGEGFYLSASPFKPFIEEEDIPVFLEEHGREAAPLFKGGSIEPTPHPLRYALFFDKGWNLHLSPYLFRKDDLKGGLLFPGGTWGYLKGKGFFKIEKSLSLPALVKEEEMVAFLRDFKPWLNEQEGFRTHYGSLEGQITYHLGAHGELTFRRKMAGDKENVHDFGGWIYWEGQGFFPRATTPLRLPVEEGHTLRADMVAPFIRLNKEALQEVDRFFCEEDPLASSGVSLTLEPSRKLRVEPVYEWKPEFRGETIKLYEEWAYNPQKGFHEIPLDKRVPKGWEEIKWIPEEEQRQFFEEVWPAVKNRVKSLDPQLAPPLSLSLHLLSIREEKKAWLVEWVYRTEKGSISIEAIDQALKQKSGYLFSLAGRLDLKESRFEWIRRLKKEGKKIESSMHITTQELLRINAYEEIRAEGEAERAFSAIKQLQGALPFDYSQLQSTLRPYQEKGALWLFSLYMYGVGGLLCDEMGLGKTHQAMALMAGVRKSMKSAKFLVVCPTSVIWHWLDKLTRYFPSIPVILWHGPERSRMRFKEGAIYLTSYGILRIEKDRLEEVDFEVAIFDELQLAKNHKSKLYSALLKVKSFVKIGLTGTPIENRLRELKALFDVVLPGYMPGEMDYHRSIVGPIERGSSLYQKGLLQRLIHPFILRREKKEVLRELPEKIEEVSFCELHPLQERLYHEVLMRERAELLGKLSNPSEAVPVIHVFSLLSRLKQVCDHPALYLKQGEHYKKYHSGKWDLFVELLNEAQESGEKVVVFSQYLGMLDIIESYLTEEQIGFASLRGSTRDRKEQIERFSIDPECRVFVASLKAAGLGVDLTAASIVIHYDRWWNAARENQATDRVHRIGQKRGVQVFKLVTKLTFEERIHQIIERKKALMEENILADDHTLLKVFSRDELVQLIS